MIDSIAELDSVRDECRRLVTRRALTAAATSVVPVPGIDIAADVGILTTMLPQISEKFELSEAQVERLEPHVAQKVLVLASGLGNGLIGRAVTKRIVAALLRRVATRLAVGSAARFVPFAGSALAAGLGFGAMKMVGNSHIDDCYRTARALIDGRG